MRRQVGLSFALVIGFLVTLGVPPVMLAKQGSAGDWSDIVVTCGPENLPCDEIEEGRYQDYRVALLPTAFFPEITYSEAMVVRILSGTLAFRVTSPEVDIVVEHTGEGIPIVTTDIDLQVGQAPDPNNLPTYTNTGETMQQHELCSQPPLSNLCLLDAEYFLDGIQTGGLQTEGLKTFVQLGEGDIVYLTAGSMCFICNTTETGDEQAQIEVWAPGYSNSTWFEVVKSMQMLGPGPTRLQEHELHDAQAWMFNPGSPCH
jgi:hypothetical protein